MASEVAGVSLTSQTFAIPVRMGALKCHAVGSAANSKRTKTVAFRLLLAFTTGATQEAWGKLPDALIENGLALLVGSLRAVARWLTNAGPVPLPKDEASFQ